MADAQHRRAAGIHATSGREVVAPWYPPDRAQCRRLEELKHYSGNATFDDAGTAGPRNFPALTLRRGSKQRRPRQANRFVLDSQYRFGLWRNVPTLRWSGLQGLPDTAYATFNDDVAAENRIYCCSCYKRLVTRAARVRLSAHERAASRHNWGQPQPGWGLHIRWTEPRVRALRTKRWCAHYGANNLADRALLPERETKFLPVGSRGHRLARQTDAA